MYLHTLRTDSKVIYQNLFSPKLFLARFNTLYGTLTTHGTQCLAYYLKFTDQTFNNIDISVTQCSQKQQLNTCVMLSVVGNKQN